MPHVAVTEIHRRVDEHEKQLGLVRGELAGLGREVHNVRETQVAQNHKLDQIMTAVATMQAHKPVNSMEALKNGISMIKDLALLLGAVGATIIFLAGSVFNNDDSKLEIAVLKDRLERPAAPPENAAVARIEERLNFLEHNRAWTPNVTLK